MFESGLKLPPISTDPVKSQYGLVSTRSSISKCSQKSKSSKTESETSKRNTYVGKTTTKKSDVRPPHIRQLDVQRNMKVIHAKYVRQFPKMSPRLVENLMWYVLGLTEDGELIDMQIFTAEMIAVFNIKKKEMIENIYTLMRGDDEVMTMTQFMKLLNIYLSDDLDVKSNFTFDVYDTNHDGKVLEAEMKHYLWDSMGSYDLDYQINQADEYRETINDLVELTLAQFRITASNNVIYKARYQEVVREKPELLEFLGQTLPNSENLRHFRERVINQFSIAPQTIWLNQTHHRSLLLRQPRIGAQARLQNKPQTMYGLYDTVKVVFPDIAQKESRNKQKTFMDQFKARQSINEKNAVSGSQGSSRPPPAMLHKRKSLTAKLSLRST